MRSDLGHRKPDGKHAVQPKIHGRAAKVLQALHDAGARGLTTSECLQLTYLLSSYVHKLRRAGFIIETRRESSNGRWCARYILAPSKLHHD